MKTKKKLKEQGDNISKNKYTQHCQIKYRYKTNMKVS